MICECLIWLSLASYHINREQEYREINPGVAIERGGYLGGVYHNSHSRTTVFAARVFDLVGRDRIQGIIGFGTGYKHPYVGALRVRVGHAAIVIVPPIGDTKGVIAINALLP